MKSESEIEGSKITAPTNGRATATPYYVLMDNHRPLGPEVVRSDSGPECAAVYGYSGRHAYDQFRRDSETKLAPYPLVKGYLRNQVDASGDGLRLVVVNAVSSCDIVLQAATMLAVLQAQEQQTANVVAAYRLTFDPAVKAYRIEKADV